MRAVPGRESEVVRGVFSLSPRCVLGNAWEGLCVSRRGRALVSRLDSTTGDVVEAPAPLPFALLLAPQLAHHSGFALSPNIAPSLQALLYRVVPALFGTQQMLHSSSGRRCMAERTARYARLFRRLAPYRAFYSDNESTPTCAVGVSLGL